MIESIDILSLLNVAHPFALNLPLPRHELYKRATKTGTDSLVAVLAPDAAMFLFTGPSSSKCWVWVRAVSACGVGDGENPAAKLVRVAFDAAGNLILPVPNTPINQRLVLGAGGQVSLSFSSGRGNEAAPAVVFNVYVATGVAPFDFGTVNQTSLGGRTAAVDLGTFAHGTTVRAVVRAEAATGAEEDNTNEVSAVADAQAPDAPTSFTVEVTAS